MAPIKKEIDGVSFDLPFLSKDDEHPDFEVFEKFQEVFFSLHSKYGSYSGFIALLREYLAAQHQAIIYDNMGSYFIMKDIGRNIQSTYPKYSPLLGFFNVLPITDSNGKVSKVQSMHFLKPKIYDRYITFFIDPLLSQNLHLDETSPKFSGQKKGRPNTLEEIWDQSDHGKENYKIIINRLKEEVSPAINNTFLHELDGKYYWISERVTKPFVQYLVGFVWQMHVKGWIKEWQTGPTYQRILQNSFNCSFNVRAFSAFNEFKTINSKYKNPFANYPSNLKK